MPSQLVKILNIYNYKKRTRNKYQNFIVKPGVKFREIGNVIQKYVTPHGYSVVRSYCGHGIHRLFHAAPNIPHYASKL